MYIPFALSLPTYSGLPSFRNHFSSLPSPISPCATDSATPDEDYDTVRSTSVVLQAGYATGDPLDVELTVPIRDDNLFEDTETFEVVLSSDSDGVVLGATSVKTVHILDNDCKLEWQLFIL